MDFPWLCESYPDGSHPLVKHVRCLANRPWGWCDARRCSWAAHLSGPEKVLGGECGEAEWETTQVLLDQFSKWWIIIANYRRLVIFQNMFEGVLPVPPLNLSGIERVIKGDHGRPWSIMRQLQNCDISDIWWWHCCVGSSIKNEHQIHVCSVNPC